MGLLTSINLIAKYGSARRKPWGLFFEIDKDDVWYMEIDYGHHWVAQRMLDAVLHTLIYWKSELPFNLS